MYIWDSDQATEDMKPQVSCFMWLAPPGDGDGDAPWWMGVQICI